MQRKVFHLMWKLICHLRPTPPYSYNHCSSFVPAGTEAEAPSSFIWCKKCALSALPVPLLLPPPCSLISRWDKITFVRRRGPKLTRPTALHPHATPHGGSLWWHVQHKCCCAWKHAVHERTQNHVWGAWHNGRRDKDTEVKDCIHRRARASCERRK